MLINLQVRSNDKKCLKHILKQSISFLIMFLDDFIFLIKCSRNDPLLTAW